MHKTRHFNNCFMQHIQHLFFLIINIICWFVDLNDLKKLIISRKRYHMLPRDWLQVSMIEMKRLKNDIDCVWLCLDTFWPWCKWILYTNLFSYGVVLPLQHLQTISLRFHFAQTMLCVKRDNSAADNED